MQQAKHNRPSPTTYTIGMQRCQQTSSMRRKPQKVPRTHVHTTGLSIHRSIDLSIYIYLYERQTRQRCADLRCENLVPHWSACMRSPQSTAPKLTCSVLSLRAGVCAARECPMKVLGSTRRIGETAPALGRMEKPINDRRSADAVRLACMRAHTRACLRGRACVCVCVCVCVCAWGCVRRVRRWVSAPERFVRPMRRSARARRSPATPTGSSAVHETHEQQTKQPYNCLGESILIDKKQP